MRCEAYLSLATGNKGVFWFLYQTQFFDKEHQNAMGGLVNEKFKGDKRWKDVAQVTEEIQKIAPILARLEPSDDEPKRVDDVLAYHLKDHDGTDYLFAVNLNTQKTQKANLAYDGSATRKVAQVVAIPSGLKIPADTNGNAKWDDSIAPGSGALYRIDTK